MKADFATFLRNSYRAPSTISIYTSIILKLQKQFPEMDGYNYKKVIELLNDVGLSENPTSHSHTTLASLKLYYRFLISKGLRENHPCATVYLKQNKVKGILRSDLFSMDELQLLFTRTERYEKLELRNKILFSLMVFQALTLLEITKVKISHVLINLGYLQIPRSLKLAKRKLAINPMQKEWIEKYLKEIRFDQNPANLNSLLIGKAGEAITCDAIHYIVSTVQDLFPDKEISALAIRQSTIAFWINEMNIPLEQVQIMAGHKWISSTEKYQLASLDEDIKILKRVHPMG